MAADIWTLIHTWGTVLGLALDITGVILVYIGVRITIAKANALEQIALGETIDDYGSTDLLHINSRLSAARARERVRASRWAGAGLVFFIVGFLLQTAGGWPKS